MQRWIMHSSCYSVPGGMHLNRTARIFLRTRVLLKNSYTQSKAAESGCQNNTRRPPCDTLENIMANPSRDPISSLFSV